MKRKDNDTSCLNMAQHYQIPKFNSSTKILTIFASVVVISLLCRLHQAEAAPRGGNSGNGNGNNGNSNSNNANGNSNNGNGNGNNGNGNGNNANGNGNNGNGNGNNANEGEGTGDNVVLDGGSGSATPDTIDEDIIDPSISNGNPGNNKAKLIGFNSRGRREGTYLIKLKQGEGDERSRNVSRNVLNLRGGEILQDVQFGPELRVLTVRMKPKHVERLARNPNVEYLEVDRNVTLAQSGSSGCSSEAVDASKWFLDRMDQLSGDRDGSFSITSNRGEGVRVYVLDTGVHREHEQFEGRVIAESLQCIYDTNGTISTCSSGDKHGHGSHMAGSITSTDYGVANNARVVSVKVFTDQARGSTLSVFLGLQYAYIDHFINPGPAVVSMSLAARVDDDPGATGQGSIEDSIAVMHSAGMVVVVAAGNAGGLPASLITPARSPFAITVGCINQQDDLCSFSSYGSAVDILAPGTSILSTYNFRGGFQYLDGTSSSAALVSGAVAAYLSDHPTSSPDDVLFWLATTGARDKAGGNLRGTTNLIAQVPKCAAAASTA